MSRDLFHQYCILPTIILTHFIFLPVSFPNTNASPELPTGRIVSVLTLTEGV